MSDAQFVVLVVCVGYWVWVLGVSLMDRRRRRVRLAEYRWPIDQEPQR